MGRGLSSLQKWILKRASEIKRVYYADVLMGYFDFEPKEPIKRYGEGRYADHENIETFGRGVMVSPGSQHFSKRDIGVKRYAAALASLSRACARLGDRGLVTCLKGSIAHWAGVEITDKGRGWLSVNFTANCSKVNR